MIKYDFSGKLMSKLKTRDHWGQKDVICVMDSPKEGPSKPQWAPAPDIPALA
jgi:hypothetical protein